MTMLGIARSTLPEACVRVRQVLRVSREYSTIAGRGSQCPVIYTEALDYDSTKLYSGGINPANLPMKLENGKCTPLYPHARLRVNTVFEIAQAKGLTTAYTDKHPAYDLVRGPSGKGLSLGHGIA